MGSRLLELKQHSMIVLGSLQSLAALLQLRLARPMICCAALARQTCEARYVIASAATANGKVDPPSIRSVFMWTAVRLVVPGRMLRLRVVIISACTAAAKRLPRCVCPAAAAQAEQCMPCLFLLRLSRSALV